MSAQEMDEIFLKEWRVYAGLTQTELGERMGITGTQISRIEAGKRDFDGRFLMMFKTCINAKLSSYPPRPGAPLLRIWHMAEPLFVRPSENDWVRFMSILTTPDGVEKLTKIVENTHTG
jgi:transcriptional regulator with XRE-family HTH domain